jgi:hypothetical protein
VNTTTNNTDSEVAARLLPGDCWPIWDRAGYEEFMRPIREARERRRQEQSTRGDVAGSQGRPARSNLEG